ncbi:hypothetical protein [Saccharothrix sp.]|nr:hypothetical protein [Saccharothrix sp.]
MTTDPAAAEPPKPPPSDQEWLEVENVRGEDPFEEGSWPFETRGE